MLVVMKSVVARVQRVIALPMEKHVAAGGENDAGHVLALCNRLMADLLHMVHARDV